jgi:hypothetical protein
VVALENLQFGCSDKELPLMSGLLSTQLNFNAVTDTIRDDEKAIENTKAG